MSRLIDADNTISVLKILSDKCYNDNAFEQAISVLESVTTIDAVQVVRCRDCKHWNPNGIGICKLHDIRPTPLMMDDWFCADGERTHG